MKPGEDVAMRQLLLLALFVSACGGNKPSTQQAAPKTPKRTTVPSLAEEAQAAPPLPVRATVDPPLGGWSTTAATSPPPAATVRTPPATPQATSPTTAPSTARSTAPSTAPSTAAPASPAAITTHTKPPATPNSCAKSHDCAVTYAPAVAAPAATGRGSVKGLLTSDASLPACPVDLVDGGTRRVSTGTAHGGAYEISAAPGHYSVSFERCLGCNPGLIDVDIVDAATASVSLSCVATK